MTAGRRDDAAWTRLHPLSPVLRFGRAAFVLVLVVVPRFAGGSRGGAPPWPDLAIVVLALVGGVVSWLVTRWRITGGELQIETGLLRRQSVRVNAARIQAVDIVQPALGRALGLAEVRVDVAGQGRNRTRLAYLPEDEAQAVRARLLASAHGLAEQTPAPHERPVFAVDNGRLVLSALLGPPLVVLAALVVGLAAGSAGSPETAGGVAAGLVPTAFALLLAFGRRVGAEFGFTLAEAPDGLRVRAGLLQTRAQTVPFDRVQGVRLVQPVLWRPLGWCRVEVDVARQRAARGDDQGGSAPTRALLPVGDLATGRRLVERVLVGVSADPPPGARPPRRAALRAPLSYHWLAAWHDDRYAYAVTGRLRRTTTVVPLRKAQSVRTVQGPLLRALRLADVRLDTAGRGWEVSAACRDVDDAERLLADLVDAAGRQRRPVR